MLDLSLLADLPSVWTLCSWVSRRPPLAQPSFKKCCRLSSPQSSHRSCSWPSQCSGVAARRQSSVLASRYYTLTAVMANTNNLWFLVHYFLSFLTASWSYFFPYGSQLTDGKFFCNLQSILLSFSYVFEFFRLNQTLVSTTRTTSSTHPSILRLSAWFCLSTDHNCPL